MFKTVPFVSIVMAVYNGERFLRETVKSLLQQTFRDFECIIVNDGSTDSTPNMLGRLADPRITILHNDRNRGLPYSLNKGLDIAQGTFIARIDVGDLAAPERLEKQVAFLAKHAEVGIVGTGCRVINEAGEQIGEERFPTSDLEIRWTSLLNNPFLHPSVMMRRDLLVQHHLAYDPSFHATQDYELWTRVLLHARGANLEELLTVYRITERSITTDCRRLQLSNQDRVAFRTIQQYAPGVQITPEQVSRLREAFVGGGGLSKRERKQQRAAMTSLYLEVLAAFASAYYHEPGMKALRRREALNAASMVLQRRFLKYWAPVVLRLIRFYPDLLFPLLRKSRQQMIKQG